MCTFSFLPHAPPTPSLLIPYPPMALQSSLNLHHQPPRQHQSQQMKASSCPFSYWYLLLPDRFTDVCFYPLCLGNKMWHISSHTPSLTPFVSPCIFLYEITLLIGEIVVYGQALEFQEIMEGVLCINLGQKIIGKWWAACTMIVSIYETFVGLNVHQKCLLLMSKYYFHAMLTSFFFCAFLWHISYSLLRLAVCQHVIRHFHTSAFAIHFLRAHIVIYIGYIVICTISLPLLLICGCCGQVTVFSHVFKGTRGVVVAVRQLRLCFCLSFVFRLTTPYTSPRSPT